MEHQQADEPHQFRGYGGLVPSPGLKRIPQAL